MKNFFSRLLNLKTAEDKAPDPESAKKALEEAALPSEDNEIERSIDNLFKILVDIHGSDKLVIKAGKMDALQLIRSDKAEDKVLALERIISENPAISEPPPEEDIPHILDELTGILVDQIARRTMESELEKKIDQRLEEHYQDYVKDIKLQLLKEEKGGNETPMEQKKREDLEALDKVSLTKSVMELLRPSTLEEIVGQERAVKALLSKLSSPYPQHLILYGPPGVGKTTAARLVLEEAKKRNLSPFDDKAPFVETDGTTLRWDSRDMTNPLLGSVHDPIYQGARRDLAETGIPEPKPGLVTDAHGGILFIDEIGEMDIMLQNKLLKVLEDKRAYFESAYYNPADEKVPPYIKKLFDEGAPADFVLIGATTRESSHINPALRSRCAEIYFEPLTPKHIEEIILNAAKKLNTSLADGAATLISEYTIEGRKAINILADAYSLALERSGLQHQKHSSLEDIPSICIEKEDIYQVAQVSRLTPFVTKKASDRKEIGHIFGLGVAGFLGSVIEIEAVAFKAREEGKGSVRFNETAGSMAKDSVFNAASVVRLLTGHNMHDYDIHINVIGGGNIDGPSAGTAILTAIISAVTQRPIRQDTAITGEISLQGKVRPVGGVFEKAYGAKQAGITRLIIPKENEKDIPPGHLGLTICPVETAQEAIDILLEQAN